MMEGAGNDRRGQRAKEGGQGVMEGAGNDGERQGVMARGRE